MVIFKEEMLFNYLSQIMLPYLKFSLKDATDKEQSS